MSSEKGKDQRWLPIESNPEVMNSFLHNLGLPKKWSITDVYGLDEPLLAMLPQPVLALLLLFPIKKGSDDQSNLVGGELVDSEKDLFYMKQTISNACGTVAMIHSVANNLDRIELQDGFLKNFLNSSKDADPDKRAELLENDDDVCSTHDEVAHQGQTSAPSVDESVDHHFVAFVEKNGKLFELDGRKSGPVNWGSSSKDSFLTDAAKACKSYMEKDPESINFTILALTAAESE